jgi:hypothetical protein
MIGEEITWYVVVFKGYMPISDSLSIRKRIVVAFI